MDISWPEAKRKIADILMKAGGLYEMGREMGNLYLCNKWYLPGSLPKKTIKAPATRQTPRTGLLAELMSKERDAVLQKKYRSKACFAPIWCDRWDLNPYVLPHTPLKRACLPIPALSQSALHMQCIIDYTQTLRICQGVLPAGYSLWPIIHWSMERKVLSSSTRPTPFTCAAVSSVWLRKYKLMIGKSSAN